MEEWRGEGCRGEGYRGVGMKGGGTKGGGVKGGGMERKVKCVVVEGWRSEGRGERNSVWEKKKTKVSCLSNKS